jgi:hypothetical protein
MAVMKNLTGVPSVYGDLGLAGQNLQSLSDEEKLSKKKKVMSASQTNDMQTATQFLFPRYNQTGSTGV